MRIVMSEQMAARPSHFLPSPACRHPYLTAMTDCRQSTGQAYQFIVIFTMKWKVGDRSGGEPDKTGSLPGPGCDKKVGGIHTPQFNRVK
jgi:hypothetical protein